MTLASNWNYALIRLCAVISLLLYVDVVGVLPCIKAVEDANHFLLLLSVHIFSLAADCFVQITLVLSISN